jgi:hypothetical protein
VESLPAKEGFSIKKRKKEREKKEEKKKGKRARIEKQKR